MNELERYRGDPVTGALGNSYYANFSGDRPRRIIARTPDGDIWTADITLRWWRPEMGLPSYMEPGIAPLQDRAWVDTFHRGRTAEWGIRIGANLEGIPVFVMVHPYFEKGAKEKEPRQRDNGTVLTGFGEFELQRRGIRPMSGFVPVAYAGIGAITMTIGIKLAENMTINIR